MAATRHPVPRVPGRAPLPVVLGILAGSGLLLTPGALAQDPCSNPEHSAAITGTVMDRETGEPVAEAALRVEPLGCSGITDEDGRFRFAGLPPGEFTLEIRHVGYGARSVEVDVPRDRTVVLDIQVPPEAIEVEPLEVEVERTVRIPFLERNDFYNRMERGWGHFFPPEYFEKHHVISAGQVLQRIPGVRIQGGSLHDGRITMRGNPACRRWEGGPILFIDGRRVARVKTTKELHTWVGAASIGAMEVYRRVSETAPEYVSVRSACGVIVVWTKRWLGSEVAGK